jgi:RecG-like helicase
VTTLEDLLFHLPMRYEDRTAFAASPICVPGMKVSVAGTIAVAGLRRRGRLTLYEVRLDDGTGRPQGALVQTSPS